MLHTFGANVFFSYNGHGIHGHAPLAWNQKFRTSSTFISTPMAARLTRTNTSTTSSTKGQLTSNTSAQSPGLPPAAIRSKRVPLRDRSESPAILSEALQDSRPFLGKYDKTLLVTSMKIEHQEKGKSASEHC
jgi:hypothetical protein